MKHQSENSRDSCKGEGIIQKKKKRGDTTYLCILKSAKKVLLYISGPDER